MVADDLKGAGGHDVRVAILDELVELVEFRLICQAVVFVIDGLAADGLAKAVNGPLQVEIRIILLVGKIFGNAVFHGFILLYGIFNKKQCPYICACPKDDGGYNPGHPDTCRPFYRTERS